MASNIIEGNHSLDLYYGPDQQRKKSILSLQNSVVMTKFFHPSFEKTIDGSITRQINYIYSPSGLCAMYVLENGVGNMYYNYTDHLGSILTVTDGQGTIIAEQNFDAWGKNRNVNDWTYANVGVVPAWLSRGFTGHEHLPQFALINMNARMYDPLLGLMMAPDNFIQNPLNTQCYNRFGYAFNNPLQYVDKDGNYAVGVAFCLALFITVVWEGYHGASSGQMIGDGIVAGIISAATAYVGTVVAVGGNVISSVVWGTLIGAASGAASAAIAGQNVLEAAIIGASLGALFSAIGQLMPTEPQPLVLAGEGTVAKTITMQQVLITASRPTWLELVIKNYIHGIANSVIMLSTGFGAGIGNQIYNHYNQTFRPDGNYSLKRWKPQSLDKYDWTQLNDERSLLNDVLSPEDGAKIMNATTDLILGGIPLTPFNGIPMQPVFRTASPLFNNYAPTIFEIGMKEVAIPTATDNIFNSIPKR